MTPPGVQTAWAEAIVGALLASGVRRAVVSPGSRSTPLVLALADAESEGALRVLVAHDERAAGFLALGLARGGDGPALALCTSGTAGAHYLPAVIEASESRVPLLVLTADRPPERRDRGASQTTEQGRLFGVHARAFVELPVAEPDPDALDGLVATIFRSVRAARWPDPGPVHVNVPFRKPLEPPTEMSAEGAVLRERLRRRLEAGSPDAPPPSAPPAEEGVERLTRLVETARRGVVLSGPAPLSDAALRPALRRFLVRSGFGLLPEATGQQRFAGEPLPGTCDAFAFLFGPGGFRLPADAERREPDLVLRLGAAPASRELTGWLTARREAPVAVIARHGWSDPDNRAALLLAGDPGAALEAVAGRLPEGPADAGWATLVAGAADACWRRVDEALRSTGDAGGPDGGIAGPVAVRRVLAALPEDATLVLGNSLPVREVDRWCPAQSARLAVVSQRGVAGIDGLVAGAAGAAEARGRPGAALIGDVSFLHDLGGLAAAREVSVPLAVVVLDNGGGRLFEELPVARLTGQGDTFERYFLTPPRIDAAAAAAALGVPARTVGASEDLEEAVADALGKPGPGVVVVRLDRGAGRRVAERAGLARG